MLTETDAIKGRVTAGDIAEGVAGDCFKCAVARALQRATGDGEAHIYECDWNMYIQVWGRHLVAPHGVRWFVYDFDGQPRTEDSRIDLSDEECEPLAPFDFELPPLNDPEWEERCQGCEQLFDASELDGEGYCPECRDGDVEAESC